MKFNYSLNLLIYSNLVLKTVVYVKNYFIVKNKRIKLFQCLNRQSRNSKSNRKERLSSFYYIFAIQYCLDSRFDFLLVIQFSLLEIISLSLFADMRKIDFFY